MDYPVHTMEKLTPVFLSFIMTSSSQWPSRVTRTSLANRILPDIALVNSPPPKNGCKKYNHKKYQYPIALMLLYFLKLKPQKFEKIN